MAEREGLEGGLVVVGALLWLSLGLRFIPAEVFEHLHGPLLQGFLPGIAALPGIRLGDDGGHVVSCPDDISGVRDGNDLFVRSRKPARLKEVLEEVPRRKYERLKIRYLAGRYLETFLSDFSWFSRRSRRWMSLMKSSSLTPL